MASYPNFKQIKEENLFTKPTEVSNAGAAMGF